MANQASTPPAPRTWSAARAILYGTLVVGILDGLDAVVYFGLRGVAPRRLFQGIATALLGPAAFHGGLPAALLGVACHLCVAMSVVAVYYAVAGRAPLLTRRAIPCGALYGLLVYVAMNYVVLPLTLAYRTAPTPLFVANGLFAHLFCVGIPTALIARRALTPRPAAPS
jgi:hypothetical protein